MTNDAEQMARGCWSAAALADDPSWIYDIAPAHAAAMIDSIRSAHIPGKDLLDYDPADFALGLAMTPVRRAFAQAQNGRGIALVRGLPRQGVTAEEFGLLTWAIGLHVGVARPQGKASQYLSPVRNVGTVYRSTTGRGYSSNAELDFHIDGGDLVALTCYNGAKSGGTSLVTSSFAAHEVMKRERPDLLEALYQPYFYNKQGEEAPDEAPVAVRPVFTFQDGKPICGWNRNRIEAAQTRPEVPRMSALQREAIEYLDAVVRRPDLVFRMQLQPGDMQILSNHVTLHSRTVFEDHEDMAARRLLFRLWLTPEKAEALPKELDAFFYTCAPNTVRGGINGQNYDAGRVAFERRLAAYHGMNPPVSRPSA